MSADHNRYFVLFVFGEVVFMRQRQDTNCSVHSVLLELCFEKKVYHTYIYLRFLVDR